jgi:hypothetical protein
VESSFGWLQDNPFLTTKWGGIIALISAGVFGTLAELEASSNFVFLTFLSIDVGENGSLRNVR